MGSIVQRTFSGNTHDFKGAGERFENTGEPFTVYMNRLNMPGVCEQTTFLKTRRM